MQVLSINCPACGGVYGGRISNKFITCQYCGTRFKLSRDELEAMGFEDANHDGYDDDEVAASVLLAPDANIDSLPELAKDLCDEFLEAHANQNFDCTNKILAGLGISSEEVFLIHDDTMFHSGKNGFAITSTGLFCREMGDKTAHFVSWEGFAKGNMPELDGSYVRQKATSICYFTDNDYCKEDLLQLYLQLWRAVR